MNPFSSALVSYYCSAGALSLVIQMNLDFTGNKQTVTAGDDGSYKG